MPVSPRVALALAAISMALSTQGAVAAQSPPSTAPKTTAVTSTISWGACATDVHVANLDGQVDCGTAEVPLDYDRPAGGTIDLSLMRRLADDPSRRIGTLFLNPGGPGGSGVDMVPAAEAIFPPELLAQFDIVGFDPRGVARSAPLVCFPSPEDGYGLLGSLPPFPLTLREDATYASKVEDLLVNGCEEHASAILDHMSTANTARDLDQLRAAVGDTQLSYFGVSYGSQLGTTYANMFPERVRAIVVDGTLDPVAWTTGRTKTEGRAVPVTSRVGSAASAEATLERFFEKCSDAGPMRCALAAGDPAQRYEHLASQLRREPLKIDLGGGVINFTYAALVATTLSTLHDPDAWADYARFVALLAGGQTGKPLAQSYARVQDTIGQSMESPYERQSIEGFPGVLCADSDNPTNAAAWSAVGRLQDLRSHFGRLWAWRSIPCATWTGHDQDRYTGPWNMRTSNPVLVVGSLYDPATPYAGAKAVAAMLPGARLLTLNGEGHVSRGLSPCIDDAEVTYLLTKQLPPVGTVCQSEAEPFPSPTVAPLTPAQERHREARRALLASALNS